MTYQPFYRKSIASILSVAFMGMMSPISAVNAVAVISEVTPVGSPTSNPTYVFNSDSTGSIAYGWPCTSGFSSAVIGPNTIVFNTGSEGIFSLCTVSVDDGLGGWMSNILTLADFFIDTTAPSISLLGPATVNLIVNQPYNDPGASWTDNDPNNGSGPAMLTMTGDTAIWPIWPTSSGTINTSYTGTYTYSYNITDGAWNIATQRTRTVSVTTGSIPVITINAPNPAFLVVWDPAYVDAWATANDDEDGDISPIIVESGSSMVDTNVAGTYLVTYDVTDSNGNAAAQQTRTVFVNGLIPIITVVGWTGVVLHELWTPYVESGATANGPNDGFVWYSGAVGSGVTSSGTVDWTQSGTYYVDYMYTDSLLVSAITVTKTVVVADRTAPWIILVGSGIINIPLNNIYIDAGANWTDLIDGSGAIFASGTVNTGALGSYTLSYHRTDAAGNVGTPVSRTVNVTTGSLPVITLSGNTTINVLVWSTFIEPGATAMDLEDGDISASGSRTGALDTNTVGTYILTYSVTDSNMNTVTATRTVNVTAGALPVITLSGSNPVNLLLGDIYTESGFTILDTEDGDITASGTSTGSVNTSVPGIYIISYSVTDSHMNTVTVTRNVNVLDTILPVITLVGSSNVTINAGQAYTELGATWTDNVDGSGSAVVSGVVNSSLAGLYVLSYNYTDAAGNTGALVQRSVTVVWSVSLPISGAGGGMGTSYATTQTDFNSAPSSSNTVNMDSENLMIPSIARLLRNSTIPHDDLVTDNSSSSDSSTDSQVVTHTVVDPITDYICPVVSELQNIDNDQIANISEGEFTEDVQALLMYRGLDNADLATNYTERYFTSRGYGIVKSNEAFEGDRAITRAEFVKMLVRALSCHYTLTDATQEFSDVGPNAWYSEYINFATNKGWISGYDNGTFAPHGLMTRWEVAKVLAKAIQLNTDATEMNNTIDTTMNSATDDESFNLDDLFSDSTENPTSNMDTTMDDTTNSSDLFADVPMSSSFAPYIYALRDQGILNGKTRSVYGINNNISRNEVARIFHKIFINVNN